MTAGGRSRSRFSFASSVTADEDATDPSRLLADDRLLASA